VASHLMWAIDPFSQSEVGGFFSGFLMAWHYVTHLICANSVGKMRERVTRCFCLTPKRNQDNEANKCCLNRDVVILPVDNNQ
jgi:hypothetical protein